MQFIKMALKKELIVRVFIGYHEVLTQQSHLQKNISNILYFSVRVPQTGGL